MHCGGADMGSDDGRPGPGMSADELASRVAHGLRTPCNPCDPRDPRDPLNAISGWLHLRSADPAQRPDAAERALAGMRRALDQPVAQITPSDTLCIGLSADPGDGAVVV